MRPQPVAQLSQIELRKPYGILVENVDLVIVRDQKGLACLYGRCLHNPNFAEYGEFCGAQGIRVKRNEDLDAAMISAWDHSGPSVIEVMADSKLL
ncbi:MAG: thiamine pyrophosphate-dependent enzyme [Verrucomicrobiota bacterium]